MKKSKHLDLVAGMPGPYSEGSLFDTLWDIISQLSVLYAFQSVLLCSCLSVASRVVWEALAQENLSVDKDRQLTAKEMKFLWVLHFDREMKCTELSAVGKEDTYIADWSL